MFDLPTFSEATDKAVSAENLKAAASHTTDPAILLGLACLARTGSSVWREISGVVSKLRPEYAPILAVLALTRDGIDENVVAELITRDPDNALGYYLQANLLYDCDRDLEALQAFRKGAHCSELRLYEPTTAEALFKALDVLNLTGRYRLCALSWMACRSSQLNDVLQFISWPLSEFARHADAAAREEMCELLIVLAGHLFATNYYNRWPAKQALESAIFGLNAKVPAADRFATIVASAGATRPLVKSMLRWPDIKPKPNFHEEMRPAQFLPDRIHRAFAAADPSRMNAANLGEMNVNLPDSRKAAFERAKENLIRTGKALIDAALTDPDRIIGAYLRGIPSDRNPSDGRLVLPRETLVEKLARERPDVFTAAAANEAAMSALCDTGASDPSRRNIMRLMEIGSAIYSYAFHHQNTYADDIDVLFEQGYLKPPLKPNSVFTDKPYIYAAAGEKVPEKWKDKSKFVVLYDDKVDQWGFCQCIFASWIGGAMRADEVEEQLRKRGKSPG